MSGTILGTPIPIGNLALLLSPDVAGAAAAANAATAAAAAASAAASAASAAAATALAAANAALPNTTAALLALMTTWLASLPTAPQVTPGWWNNGGTPAYS